MEKKITRRIVGILVIVALVIILLPLLFTGNEQQSSGQMTSEAKTPQPTPEPDVSIPTPVATTTTATTTATEPTPSSAPMTTVQNTLAQQPSLPLPSNQNITSPLATTKNALPTPVDSNQPSTPPVVTVVPGQSQTKPTIDSAPSSTQPSDQASNNKQDPKTETIKLLDDDTIPQRTDVFHPTSTDKKLTYRSKLKMPVTPVQSITNENTDSNASNTNDKNLANNVNNDDEKATPKKHTTNPRKAGWVVQMGSFKNKSNAKNLTAMLRAKGYKAFTYEVKSSGQTRVCVGPVAKQANASSLSKKIEHKTKIRGIIVNYNPLEI